MRLRGHVRDVFLENHDDNRGGSVVKKRGRQAREVFADFIVVMEDANGIRHASLTPEAFRAATGCSKEAFLGDCVERWNAHLVREGSEDRVRLEMVTRPSKREAETYRRAGRR